MVTTVDTVCGALQAKLHTKELFLVSSLCVLLGSRFGDLTAPCEFQRLSGKASARNWKLTIKYLEQPLSCFLESYTDVDGKHCCQFVDSVCLRVYSVQPPHSTGVSTNLDKRTTATYNSLIPVAHPWGPNTFISTLSSCMFWFVIIKINNQPAHQIFQWLWHCAFSRLDSIPVWAVFQPVAEPKFV